VSASSLEPMTVLSRVVRVLPDGSVEPDVEGAIAPELYVDVDHRNQVWASAERDMIERARLEGWELLSGFAGRPAYQALTRGLLRLEGELEARILSCPGLYCLVVVETQKFHPATAGWVIAYRPEGTPTEEDTTA
jgi:hypothetical protein